MMEQVEGNFAAQLRLALIEAGTEIYVRQMALTSANVEERQKAPSQSVYGFPVEQSQSGKWICPESAPR